jgi:hypothetical protein
MTKPLHELKRPAVMVTLPADRLKRLRLIAIENDTTVKRLVENIVGEWIVNHDNRRPT